MKFGTPPNTLLSGVVNANIVEKNFLDALLKLFTNILNAQTVVEIKSLEAYPILFSERNGYDNTFKDRRESYIKGYDQAMQDFLEKAEIYLKTRVYYNMHPNNITTAIQDFKNYIQNESEK